MSIAARPLLSVLAAPLCAAAAHAQAPGAAPTTATVAPLVISAGPAPKLLSSFPADGATVAAGVITVTLKFDQLLAKKSSLLNLSPSLGASAPSCLAEPRELDDGKTLVMLCATRPGRTYALTLGPGSGLMGADEKSIQAADLHFSTNDTIIDNIPDALEAAGLPLDADPVMGWREVGGADTTSPGAPLPPKPTTKAVEHD